MKPQRISVIGCAGSGKTTVARRLAEVLALPHVELDERYWGPGWTETNPKLFQRRVREVMTSDQWIIDGNYQSKLGALVWERADLVVWVNPPRSRVMQQLTVRVLRRALRRQELWNGNREGWRALRLWSPRDSMIRWAWDSYAPQVERYEAAMADPRHSDLPFRRLRSRRDGDAFIAELSRIT